jgi:hypothetical protein
MNFKAKYVIVDSSAIVFFEGIAHSEMVRHHQKCDGAGFVDFRIETNEYGEKKVQAVCYGESISLNIKSRGDMDSYILTRQICGNDYD